VVKITLRNNGGFIFDREQVGNFIQRIDNLITELSKYDIDTMEIQQFRQLVKTSMCFSPANLWFIEHTEYELEKYITGLGDLPF